MDLAQNPYCCSQFLWLRRLLPSIHPQLLDDRVASILTHQERRPVQLDRRLPASVQLPQGMVHFEPNPPTLCQFSPNSGRDGRVRRRHRRSITPIRQIQVGLASLRLRVTYLVASRTQLRGSRKRDARRCVRLSVVATAPTLAREVLRGHHRSSRTSVVDVNKRSQSSADSLG